MGKVQIREGSVEGFSPALASLSQRKACIKNSAVLKNLALFWDLILSDVLKFLLEIHTPRLLCILHNLIFGMVE